MGRQAAPAISVIVATRNRQAALGNFLDALRALPDDPAWELIVVNNGSTDGTEELLSAASADLPILSVYEERPGKSRALNRALARAKGELLLFTDDDVVPEQRWLTALYHASLDFPDANVFGGKIVVNQDKIPRWIAGSYNLKTILVSEQDLGPAICRFAHDQYPMGPNLAVRRRLVEQGSVSWPVNLGPGTKIPVGDERAFLVQISPPHLRDRLYVPQSVVLHNVGVRGLNIKSAVARCFLGGFSAGLVRRVYGHCRPRRRPGAARLALQRLRRASSVPELICIVARTLGVAAGMVSPLPRIVFGSNDKPCRE